MFEVKKNELLRKLSVMQGITGRKTTLSILNNVFMKWEGGFLYLTGTDLETTIQESLEAKVYKEGKASVSSRKLFEIVKELSGESVRIQGKENYWINIQCEKAVFNLSGLDPDEFPSLPAPEGPFVSVSLQTLKEMIEKTAFAAASEERSYGGLNNVLFSWQGNGDSGKLRLVATDGYRLSLIEKQTPFVKGTDVGVMIPKKSILEVKKVLEENEDLEEVGIYFSGSNGFFRVGSSLVTIRLSDEKFPEYEQVIPKKNSGALVVDRDSFCSSLRRISSMSDKDSRAVKLSFNGNGGSLEISSSDREFGFANEELNVSYEGPPLEIGFNSRYLFEGLQAMESSLVSIELSDGGSPCVVRPKGSGSLFEQVYVLMPMRL